MGDAVCPKARCVTMATSSTKRVLAAAESRMTNKGRGMFKMPAEEIRAGYEKLMGNWPEGTPQAEIDQFEELRRSLWEKL